MVPPHQSSTCLYGEEVLETKHAEKFDSKSLFCEEYYENNRGYNLYKWKNHFYEMKGM